MFRVMYVGLASLCLYGILLYQMLYITMDVMQYSSDTTNLSQD